VCVAEPSGAQDGRIARSIRDATIPDRQELTMLWTVLIILAIVALAIWILSRVRGRV
jgi:hypothetical protein